MFHRKEGRVIPISQQNAARSTRLAGSIRDRSVDEECAPRSSATQSYFGFNYVSCSLARGHLARTLIARRVVDDQNIETTIDKPSQRIKTSIQLFWSISRTNRYCTGWKFSLSLSRLAWAAMNYSLTSGSCGPIDKL